MNNDDEMLIEVDDNPHGDAPDNNGHLPINPPHQPANENEGGRGEGGEDDEPIQPGTLSF